MRNFLKALLVCGLVSVTGVLLDRILRADGIAGRYLLDLSNVLTGAFAGALFYYVTREQARKQKLMEEKLRIIAAFASTGRSGQTDSPCPSGAGVQGAEYFFEALAMIFDDAHDARERRRLAGIEIIDQAVSRITWALKEVLPKYPPEPVDDVAAASQKKLAARAGNPESGRRSAS